MRRTGTEHGLLHRVSHSFENSAIFGKSEDRRRKNDFLDSLPITLSFT
jgi:hypothetical protein